MPHYEACDEIMVLKSLGITYEEIAETMFPYKDKKKILYIHGYSSSKDSLTGKKLAQYLPNTDVITETFSANPHEAIEQANKLISEHKIDLVVASSYGAFFAMQLKGTLRLLINPCLYPSEQFGKRHPEFQYLSECVELEKTVLENNFQQIYAIFATNDELFSYKEVFAKYCSNIIMVKDKHRLNYTNIKKVVVPKIKALID